jgi:hypothetical protein
MPNYGKHAAPPERICWPGAITAVRPPRPLVYSPRQTRWLCRMKSCGVVPSVRGRGLRRCPYQLHSGGPMRRLRNIDLVKYNAHLLDHIQGRRIVSREERPFDDTIRSFILDHVRKCSELQRPRAAVFDQPLGPVAASCRRILGQPSSFTTESPRIAEELYETMSRNRNIDPGILVVCLCRNNDQRYSFLALLKMDPHSIFRAQLGPNVDIVLDGQGLPDPQRHLQKFALVRRPNGDGGPHILLQDMQARADEVANFFQRDFLHCSFCKDDSARTKEFAVAYRNWLNGKVEDRTIAPEEADRLMKAGDGALRSRHINAEDFARSQLEDAALRDDLLNHFAEKNIDPDFDVDPVTAGRYIRWKKIRFDRGELKIKEADLADRDYIQVDHDPEDAAINIVRIRTRIYHFVT